MKMAIIAQAIAEFWSLLPSACREYAMIEAVKAIIAQTSRTGGKLRSIACTWSPRECWTLCMYENFRS